MKIVIISSEGKKGILFICGVNISNCQNLWLTTENFAKHKKKCTTLLGKAQWKLMSNGDLTPLNTFVFKDKNKMNYTFFVIEDTMRHHFMMMHQLLIWERDSWWSKKIYRKYFRDINVYFWMRQVSSQFHWIHFFHHSWHSQIAFKTHQTEPRGVLHLQTLKSPPNFRPLL